MDYLTKHQLILVALLVSFVTSLATGIVTVSLMDQAPDSVTRTITQVIQQTVAGVPTGASSTAAVAIAVSDQVADATAKVTPSIVRLRNGDKGEIVGMGIVVSPQGSIMADKTLIDSMNEPQALFSNGVAVPIAVERYQVEGQIAFMTLLKNMPVEIRPITFGTEVRLGSSVWALAGGATYNLSQGIVTHNQFGTGTSPVKIDTSLLSSQLMSGTPLFDATGAVVGITTKTLLSSTTATFYPIILAKEAIPR